MFRKIFFLFLLISFCHITSAQTSVDLPRIDGYADAQEGLCANATGEEPNYSELWFMNHPANCTSICDDLPTCSGVMYSPGRYKLICRIYVFRWVSIELEQSTAQLQPDAYSGSLNYWLPTEEKSSSHAEGYTGNGERYCYIRITEAPSTSPSASPSTEPSGGPSTQPSLSPSTCPTLNPSTSPSVIPSCSPTDYPTVFPSTSPSIDPTLSPTTDSPSTSPSLSPTSDSPSSSPSVSPTVDPTAFPTAFPTTDQPTVQPTRNPTYEEPSSSPTTMPTTDQPSVDPTKCPTTDQPSVMPTASPTTDSPSGSPTTDEPSLSPTTETPTVAPTMNPSTDQPSVDPTQCPTSDSPSVAPTAFPTYDSPSVAPTSDSPSASPTVSPSTGPTVVPTCKPSGSPETSIPSTTPSTSPSAQPQTPLPSVMPTVMPTAGPSVCPTRFPTGPPSCFPTDAPSVLPSINPTGPPSLFPSGTPSTGPSVCPTFRPSTSPSTEEPSLSPTTEEPSTSPTKNPTADQPTVSPTKFPTTDQPSIQPTLSPSSDSPSVSPSVDPTASPSTEEPSISPSTSPSVDPSTNPTMCPTSDSPSTAPTAGPTAEEPSTSPSKAPTSDTPTTTPSSSPSVMPTTAPSFGPSVDPTVSPSVGPTTAPSTSPSENPTTDTPSVDPTVSPSENPTTEEPSVSPSVDPTKAPTQEEPSNSPTQSPSTDQPSVHPTVSPSLSPTTDSPSTSPTVRPTISPTTDQPTASPSTSPSTSPSVIPTDCPSVDPTAGPSYSPSVLPTKSPSNSPTVMPTYLPSVVPSVTSPCSIGKLKVLGSHFIYLDEDESFVDEDDIVFLSLGIPERYTIDKIWPSDANTENGYWYGEEGNEFWSLSNDTKQECTNKITGGFPWPRIRTQELMGLTTVTDPSMYEEVSDGTYFHNVLTLELTEFYLAPEGWKNPGRRVMSSEEELIERKVVYEIPWLIRLQTEITLTVNFSVVIPTPGPSTAPSVCPTVDPTVKPTVGPTVDPTRAPSSEDPTVNPTVNPTVQPSVSPSLDPSVNPSVNPTTGPSLSPSVCPSYSPSTTPTDDPSTSPSVAPTSRPSGSPTPREYFYFNVTLRADDIWQIQDYLTQISTFLPTQRFDVIDNVPHGGFTFRGDPAHQSDITPDELGLFTWTGANVTSDTFMTWMAESDNIRVRFDILLQAPKDCVADFTEYSSCSVTCGDGVESRTWVVTDPADAAGYCEHWNGYVDTRPCYIEVCPLIDEIVTRYAVYNPDLDENSTVCMNFTTVSNLPWKTIEDGFRLVDPNNILNEDSATFGFNPVEGCWPSWSYEEFPGYCGEKPNPNSPIALHPPGMFIEIDADDTTGSICKEVCDYFDTDCIGYDVVFHHPQPPVCEVLGPLITETHAQEANAFAPPGRSFTWYTDVGTQITGGYFLPQVATCYKKGDPIYTGNCLQDFNMCFTMDFVCNLDDSFYLEVQAENLISGTQITRQFETRIATDASCAEIIGDVQLSGSLEAFHNEARDQSVIQFYKGNMIYFTANINSYANVDSISLTEMRYTQDATEGAATESYPTSHATAVVTGTSEVEAATQTFNTEGKFSMLVTDPIQGSVDGVYTKFVATFTVLFVNGRRELVEGTYSRSIRAEINTLIYPPRCSSPVGEPGETLEQTCDEGKRILWCDENGQWTMLVDSCGEDVPVQFGTQSTDSPSVTRIVETEEDDAFIWRTSAIAIGVSLCAACCVYYLVVCRRQQREKKAVSFYGETKTPGESYAKEVPEEESSELGTNYFTPGEYGVTKRTPDGVLFTPTAYENAAIEHDSESSELGTDLHTYNGKDINSDIDQDMKAANQVFNDLGLHDILQEPEPRPATPI